MKLSEEYNSHLKIYTNATTQDIKAKVRQLENLIRDIKKRMENNEDYTMETRNFTTVLRNIKRSIEKNIETISDKKVRFKGESNIDIRKNNLQDCVDDLEALFESLKIINDVLIIKYKKFIFISINNKAIEYHTNALQNYIKKVRKNNEGIYQELTKYLIHIEKEAKMIEQVKRLFKLKYSQELFEKTNIDFLYLDPRIPCSAYNQKIQLCFYDTKGINEELVKDMSKMSNSSNRSKGKKQVINPRTSVRVSGETKLRDLVEISSVFRLFKKQNKPLHSFLFQNKKLSRKKFFSLYGRIILKYNHHINIMKQRVSELGFNIPIVTNKRS